MTRRTRATLKERFQQGKMPNQDDFSDLIESMLNMLDEGFDKTPKDGFKLAQLGDGKLMSFYKDIDVGQALWKAGLEKGSEAGDSRLSFQDEGGQPVLTLAYKMNEDETVQRAVGINQIAPQHELDVGGTLAAWGRVGKPGAMAVPADGNWYDITGTLTGCQLWEVVAGVGGKDSDGKYAVMHAFATNAFNGNDSITYHQSYFGNKCCRIELRWQGTGKETPFDFKLQMRVGCPYDGEVWIKYHMTQLWLDTLMLESDIKPAANPQPAPPAKGKKAA